MEEETPYFNFETIQWIDEGDVNFSPLTSPKINAFNLNRLEEGLANCALGFQDMDIQISNLSGTVEGLSGSSRSVPQAPIPLLWTHEITLLEGEQGFIEVLDSDLDLYTDMILTDNENVIFSDRELIIKPMYIDIPEYTFDVNLLAVDSGTMPSETTYIRIHILNLVSGATTVTDSVTTNDYVGSQVLANSNLEDPNNYSTLSGMNISISLPVN